MRWWVVVWAAVVAVGLAGEDEEEMHDVQVYELYGEEEEELAAKKWGPRVVAPRRKNSQASSVQGSMSDEEMRKVHKEVEAAIKAGDVAAVARYLDAGFDVEGQGIPDVRRLGYTPAVNAVVHRQPEVLKLLLDRGADPDIRTIWYTSPMSIAAFCKPDDPVAIDKCVQCVDLLLAYGADVDGRTDDGWTPLFHAARNRNLKLLEHLIARGADETLRETFNNELESRGEADLRDYLDHALLRSSADWAQCMRGTPQVKGNCNRVQAWAKARIAERAARHQTQTVEATADAAQLPASDEL